MAGFATTPRSIVSQRFALNVTSDDITLSAPPYPYYEEYRIPNTDLTLHLTLLGTFSLDPMKSCLQTALLWVGHQTQTAEMTRRDFDWKDSAGAMFVIQSLSRRLTWGEVNSVLKGLKQDLLDETRIFTATFTVEDRTEESIIGKGRLSRYTPPDFPLTQY